MKPRIPTAKPTVWHKDKRNCRRGYKDLYGSHKNIGGSFDDFLAEEGIVLDLKRIREFRDVATSYEADEDWKAI